MAHCKDFLHFEVCEAFGKTVKFPVDDGVCLHFAKGTNVLTNADRIRSMTDEELVVFLDEFRSRCINCVEDAKNQICPIYKEGYYCRPRDIMGWLKQTAE